VARFLTWQKKVGLLPLSVFHPKFSFRPPRPPFPETLFLFSFRTSFCFLTCFGRLCLWLVVGTRIPSPPTSSFSFVSFDPRPAVPLILYSSFPPWLAPVHFVLWSLPTALFTGPPPLFETGFRPLVPPTDPFQRGVRRPRSLRVPPPKISPRPQIVPPAQGSIGFPPLSPDGR